MPPIFVVTNSNGYDLPDKISSMLYVFDSFFTARGLPRRPLLGALSDSENTFTTMGLVSFEQAKIIF